ncbi:efflux RND transporter permease subunit [uncultured Rikenella sp.]|uniref:efflux RND transporter permease subunit n=1 Tax=uncultured Rikenella sp. TaxID=368003 RepID=UPI00272D3C9A|nr:efflux RND transporter permease subunit [uncultured Rikenella sp.]
MSTPTRRISPFTVILVMATLMVIGIAMIPLLHVQYAPGVSQKGITVWFSWPGASARVVEQEVTSKIEGTLASISGIREMYSASYKDGGSISLSFKKEARMDAVRFDISSRLRQLYPSLPDGVSYPQLSTGMDGESASPVLTYTINADLPTWQIEQYAEKNIAEPLSRVEGVRQVSVTGATPFEWVVTFDPNRCATLGLTGQDIRNAFQRLARNDQLGIGTLETDDRTGEPRQIRIGLRPRPVPPEAWERIEVGNCSGRIVRLGEVATVEHRQKLPETYYRINGLNNINLTIYAEKHVNTLVVTDALKAKVEEIRASLPPGYAILLADDTSVYIRGELSKIYWRTGLSVLILLLFVFLTSRSWRYLWMIVLTLACNVLVAFIFYNLFGLEIHLYSLAGITVSLGMIIDTSIIMIDHYGRFRNRRVFLAIMGALLTTIGALSIVLFLPESQRENLVDFCAVIVINLVVSMAISVFFIPALLDKSPIYGRQRSKRARRFRTRGKRRAARMTARYARFLRFARRWRWAFIAAAVLGFGLPVQLLPAKIEHKNDPARDSTLWVRAYNATIGSTFYQQKAKEWFEGALGGSMRLFAKKVYNSNFYNDPERTRLIIGARLPEGCTVHQLNETMRDMENFLSGFDEIDMFRTSITGYDNGQITVTFRPEADRQGFAFRLKDLATSKAISLGGADWSIYGVGQGFNNSLSSGWKSNRITLRGYNYEQLYRYAQELVDSISVNPRVSDPEIMGRVTFGGKDNRTEFYLDLNFDRFALYGVTPSAYYRTLSEQVYRQGLPSFYHDGRMEQAVLVSSEAERFDAWHMRNDILTVGDRNVKLSELGELAKRRSGNNIYKYNQQYSLIVAFDFVGSYELANRFTDRQAERLRAELPVGYSVANDRGGGWWGDGGGTPYWLLGLIIVIIYFICSVLFESLRQPLVIIAMIPISFIGVFLTFYLFELRFDQGGFASFVLLSGLVVNAGIYLINDYNLFLRNGVRTGLPTYLRAYNRKIVPILLTVLSTVLGLVPFVVVSREPFWFSFAAGAMGGMLFSLIAILLFLPIFLPLKQPRKSYIDSTKTIHHD